MPIVFFKSVGLTWKSPIPWKGSPISPARMPRMAAARRAEQARRATRSSTSERCQCPTSSSKGLPRRSSRLHRSCTPWMPWLYISSSGSA